MSRPTTFPEWDTTEVNLTEANATHKDEGWLADDGSGVPEKPPLEYFNWYQNLVYKWLVYFDIVIPNTVTITTQTEFDDVFDGVTDIEDVSIYISSGSYILNDTCTFGSNVTIDSDVGVTITRALDEYFVVHGIVSAYLENIVFTNNWTFDGDSLSVATPFVSLDYVTKSSFTCNVINCVSTTNGGAYSDVNELSNNITIENVSDCQAVNGGAIWGLSGGYIIATAPSGYNTIKNITGCIVSNDGGAISGCKFSNIYNITENSAPTGNGGGCTLCEYCTINYIYLNTTSGNGGGIHNSDNCIVTNVLSNTATGAGGGGGVAECDNSTFKNVNDNEATNGNGGGLYLCNQCSIDMVLNNEASHATTSLGGGLDSCTECTISNVMYNSCPEISAISQCSDCIINNVLYNSSGDSVAIGSSDHCTITNVSYNTSTGWHSALALCDYCTITNIIGNICTDTTRASIFACDFCIISNVDGLGTTVNKGVQGCDNCNITGVHRHSSASSGGGVYDCNECKISVVTNNIVTNDNGGGLHNCYRCTIDTVIDNESASNHGGGLSECNFSHITNVDGNDADGSGGGCWECDFCAISNVQNNTAVNNGGGAGNCTSCNYSGYWGTNSASSNDNIDAGSGTIFISRSSAATIQTTYQASINVN